MDLVTVTCPGCGRECTSRAYLRGIRHQCSCGAFFVLACQDGQWTAAPAVTPEELSRQGGGWKAKYGVTK